MLSLRLSLAKEILILKSFSLGTVENPYDFSRTYKLFHIDYSLDTITQSKVGPDLRGFVGPGLVSQ